MSIPLDELPVELLSHIVAHCENARTLRDLSLTSKRLYQFVRSDGFRVFVQNRFPSILSPPYWQDAAHALTTLSRNWDRKAFIAKTIAPPNLQLFENAADRATRRPNRRRQQQTMGYQPVIDSYEEWSGGSWSSRKEMLVWGAGAELMIRCRKMGDLAEQEWHAHKSIRRQSVFDQHHHMHDWSVYKMTGSVDGRDDITSANLLRCTDEGPEHIFVGRASGSLAHISVSIQDSTSAIACTYSTSGRPVRSATLSTGLRPTLAACLADSAVALYSTDVAGRDIEPLDEVAAVPPGAPGRTWSSKFLHHDRLAIGRGPSGQPILVYGITQTGFSRTPLRRFDVQAETSEEMDFPPTTANTTSVYPIIPVAPSSLAGGAEGDIFLSGGYDGNIRLHDLRSPASSTARFVDIVDNSAIYSLLAFGRERFVAGSSRYTMLKVFDLRMPGGKKYHHTNVGLGNDILASKKPTLETGRKFNHNYPPLTEDIPSDHNYNMYLEVPDQRNPGRDRDRLLDSPVYSLTAPSSCSPSFYAGVENGVVQIDAVSALDPYPDPIFNNRMGWGPSTVDHRWNPNRDVMRLRLYEHKTGNIGMLTQRTVSSLAFSRGKNRYWDERWHDGR